MRRSTRYALAVASTLSSTTAFLSGGPLGSCADVQCPPASTDNSTVEAACKVTNATYSLIGLETFDSPVADTDLSWTIGAHIYAGADEDRTVEKAFYLGKPPALDFSSESLAFQGCALFLRSNKTRPDEGSQKCEDVVGKECAKEIPDLAAEYLKSITSNGTLVNATCQQLREIVVQNATEACKSNLGENDEWDLVSAIPLTGPDAPIPPTRYENSSSTCHPTQPKSNDLTLVYSYNDTGTIRADSTRDMLDAVNLVLSVFWSPDKEAQGALKDPATNLGCLWTVDETTQSRDNKSSGDAAHMGVAWMAVWAAALGLAMQLM